MVDGLIVGRYLTAARTGGEVLTTAGFQHCCLVAIGGYGRRELAPYSDIDLMFLFHPDAAKVMPELVKQVLHPLWDSGFQVGHSVRTIQDCVDLGLADLTVRTSMMEARFLAGSADLFQQFHARYVRKVVAHGFDTYLDQKVAERQREYQKFGETVYLLEPNAKKAKAGCGISISCSGSGLRASIPLRFVNCPIAGFSRKPIIGRSRRRKNFCCPVPDAG